MGAHRPEAQVKLLKMLAARVESRREQLLKRHRKKAAAEADWYAGKDAARTAG